jgi:hypothetical protein
MTSVRFGRFSPNVMALHQRCWLRYLVEATLQISKNSMFRFPVPSINHCKPLYLIVKKELFPFTNLVEFMAIALPEHRIEG